MQIILLYLAHKAAYHFWRRRTMATLLSMKEFSFLATRWPELKQSLEIYLKIQRVGFSIITADPTEAQPVLGEDKMMALQYLLHIMGSKTLEIYNAIPQTMALNNITFTVILTARFTATHPQISDYHFRACKQLSAGHWQTTQFFCERYLRLQTSLITSQMLIYWV